MVDDDLFISKTYSNWYFGLDNTGNVMNCDNIESLGDRVKDKKEVGVRSNNHRADNSTFSDFTYHWSTLIFQQLSTLICQQLCDLCLYRINQSCW